MDKDRISRLLIKLKKNARRCGMDLHINPGLFPYWCDTNADHCRYCVITTDDFLKVRDAILTRANDGDVFASFLKDRFFNNKNIQKIQDHIISRIDNTKAFELDNLRSVCWLCHKQQGGNLSEELMLKIAPEIINEYKKRLGITPQA